MPAIRILQIGLSGTIGGIESFLINYYRHIDREQVQFDFVTYDEAAPFEEEILSLGGQVFHLPSRRTHPVQNISGVKKLLDGHQYAGLHLHLCTASNITPLFIAKNFSIPLRVVHSHNGNNGDSIVSNTLHHLNRHKLHSAATDLFACSDVAAQWMFGTTQDVTFINNAIDVEKYRFSEASRLSVRKKLGFDSQLVVGSIGRFTTQKNHSFLIDIFAALHRIHPDSQLVLAGTGSLADPVRQKVQRLGLKNCVRFLGATDNVAELLQAIDLFLMPSLYEGLPIAAIEAQAAGVYCCFSDQVTRQTDVTGNASFIPLTQSPEEWARSILASTDQFVRQDTSEKIRKAGFDIKTQAGWLQNFYLGGTQQF